MPEIKVYPEIESERLILRVPLIKDAPRITDLAGEFEIADTTLLIPHPYRLADAEDWIQSIRPHWQDGKSLQFVIILKSESILIGSIGLKDIDPVHQHGELGYWIGKQWWNKGFATEAGRSVIKYAFQELHLHRVHAHHLARNKASGSVLKKIGMHHEGTLREHIYKWGRFEDIEMYGVINSG